MRLGSHTRTPYQHHMKKTLISLLVLAGTFTQSLAHEPPQGEARYIANEAVMVTYGDTKILFDPLPLTGFGTYPDVSKADRKAIIAGEAPYDGVDVVFISHAHRDHFSASEMITYLKAHPDLKLVAPWQAVIMMTEDPSWDEVLTPQIGRFEMEIGATPLTGEISDMVVTATRIPHAGWPARAEVENLVYRVSFRDGPTISHMGDADINSAHYTPYQDYWDIIETDLAMPPYWIYLDPEGEDVLSIMNVKDSVGIHVPINVPADLKASGADFFSVSGETRTISTSAKKPCNRITFDEADFTVCSFKASDDIRLFWGEDGKPFGSFDKVEEALEADGKELVMAMNGGMYHSDRKPVGYYLEDGVKSQELMTKASSGNFGLLPNGVFHIGETGVGITETLTFEQKDLDVHSATQSGPMLVINGALHPKFRKESDSRKRRNGVGVSGDNVYFVISEEPVNFHHFGRLFKDHLGTPNALYLDGVVSRLHDAENGRSDRGFRMGPIVGVVR